MNAILKTWTVLAILALSCGSICKAQAPKLVAVVPFDDAGIADWSYLNARRPRSILVAPTLPPIPKGSEAEKAIKQAAEEAIKHPSEEASERAEEEPIKQAVMEAIKQAAKGETWIKQIAKAAEEDRKELTTALKETLDNGDKIVDALKKDIEELKVANDVDADQRQKKIEDKQREIDNIQKANEIVKNSIKASKVNIIDIEKQALAVIVAVVKSTPDDKLAGVADSETRVAVRAMATVLPVAKVVLLPLKELKVDAAPNPSASEGIAKIVGDATAATAEIAKTMLVGRNYLDNQDDLQQLVVEIENIARSRVNEVGDINASSVLPAASKAPLEAAIVDKAKNDIAQARGQSLKRVLHDLVVRFVNRTDRAFVITFDLNQEVAAGKSLEDAQKEFKRTYGSEFQLTGDKDGKTLHAQITLYGRTQPFDIDAWLVFNAPQKVLKFDVDFFNNFTDSDHPTNSTGYISFLPVKPGEFEPESKLTVNLVAGASWATEPSLGELCSALDTAANAAAPEEDKKPVAEGLLRADCPYMGEKQKHFVGLGRVDVAQNLGSRVSGKLSLSYKSGDLGAPKDDKANKVTASQYQLNVFSANGGILTYGNMTFASPSNQIAILEKGEGVRVSSPKYFRFLTVSYLVKREGAAGVANQADKDRTSLVLQTRFPFSESSFFRALELTGVHGKERDTNKGDSATPAIFPHAYETAGGELFFARSPKDLKKPEETRGLLFGSLAFYESRRRSQARADLPDGRGRDALLTIVHPSVWRAEKVEEGARPDDIPERKRPRLNITGLIGLGSVDDPKTPKDEGYVGESPGFLGDSLFGGFAGAISSATPMGQGLRMGDIVRSSLSNKRYLGAQITWNGRSLGEWIATSRFFGVDEAEIVSQSTTLSFNDVRFRSPVFDSQQAGRELSLEFNVEEPKAVKWTLKGGYFWPGEALRSFVKQNALSVAFGVSVEP